METTPIEYAHRRGEVEAHCHGLQHLLRHRVAAGELDDDAPREHVLGRADDVLSVLLGQPGLVIQWGD